ncbi:sulfite exporter TauE/SafE family protein [bacterium]|nr:sulfite exporter TauE/SafE family protein [bacterium]
MDTWTGFVLGFLGSFHCVGMCGPIVLALSNDARGKLPYLVNRLIYNLGRVITYSFLGIIAGLIGKSIRVAGYQQYLSIVLGVLILAGVLTPNRISQKFISKVGLNRAFFRVKRIWGSLFSNRNAPSMLAIGVLNGFLPCGFVYLALAGAISTGGILSSATYMAFFGLGTIPIMLATAFAGNILGAPLRQFVHRLIPIGAVLLATLFILRGLSLGIPYVSPKIGVEKKDGVDTVIMDCCHPEDSQ